MYDSTIFLCIIHVSPALVCYNFHDIACKGGIIKIKLRDRVVQREIGTIMIFFVYSHGKETKNFACEFSLIMLNIIRPLRKKIKFISHGYTHHSHSHLRGYKIKFFPRKLALQARKTNKTKMVLWFERIFIN